MRAENNIIPFDKTETEINQLKDVQHQIKVLQAKEKKLKENLINGYFANNEEFVGSEGIVLATYKTYLTKQFMGTELKKDKPELYNEYSVEVERARFEVKK